MIKLKQMIIVVISFLSTYTSAPLEFIIINIYFYDELGGMREGKFIKSNKV